MAIRNTAIKSADRLADGTITLLCHNCSLIRLLRVRLEELVEATATRTQPYITIPVTNNIHRMPATRLLCQMCAAKMMKQADSRKPGRQRKNASKSKTLVSKERCHPSCC